MTSETTLAISKYCDRYGDKLVALMERCHCNNTQQVPQEAALRYLKELEEACMDRAKIIAVDFDGTLCENCWPQIGEANQELIDYLIREKDRGAKVILWTNRVGTRLMEAVKWCAGRFLFFDEVNENTKEILEIFGSDTRKIFADEYIDDRANTSFSLPYRAPGKVE